MEILPFNFEQLPFDKQCEIVSHISDAKTVRSLLQASPHLRQLAKNCVTTLKNRNTITTDFTLMLPRLRVVYGEISFGGIGDLLDLARTNLQEARFDFNPNPRAEVQGYEYALGEEDLYVRWTVDFIHEYCAGRYPVIIAGDLGYARHHRHLLGASFYFDLHKYFGVTLDHGVLGVEMENAPEKLVRPLAKALHHYQSMRGLTLGYGMKLSSDFIKELLGMSEFNTLSVSAYLLPSFEKIIRSFLADNKLEILLDANEGEPSVDTDPSAIAEFLLSVPSLRYSRLQVCTLPITMDSLDQILQHYPLLEEVTVEITSETIEEVSHSLEQVLLKYPRLRKVHLYTPESNEEDNLEVYLKFKEVFAGDLNKIAY